ncbi:STM3941 family protein [Alteriqipengyuania lutimaris]|uniref:PH domain-containing protein n=1 Tax=Alteriqipengyuania lutimaris TaxID=1538146 RepID=A0A395LJ50_9SPHN|nr:STM3941 family protein [Alteriqipengyuania lutimaris]MBB3034015.1 hypothetical protein [Alteriqipengyuania lutimaris]RDS77036.1 hypothetical protein DL238_05030 [Alteriqipengyuania lutimaris]
MQEFVAHNSRWRLAAIFLIAAGFVALGIWFVGGFGEAPSSTRRPTTYGIAIGWLCIFFFGLCALAIAKKFFDDRPQLQIGPSGIQWCPWSDDIIPWSEISDVTSWSYNGQNTIVLHLNEPTCFPGRGLAAKLRGASRMLTGGDIAISLTGTDRGYDEAMAAIASYRSPKT